MKIEIDTGKIVDNVVSKALEIEIDGKTIKQWMVEIAKHQWISVKDRLPPAAETVLFTGTNLLGERFRAQTGYYNLGVWVAENIGIVNAIFTVTHWMPLPELPKENS